MNSSASSWTRRLKTLSTRAASGRGPRPLESSRMRQSISALHFSSTSNELFSRLKSYDHVAIQRRTLSSKPPSLDYQSLAMDRIVLNEHVSVDTAEAEANMQRLAKESENNPNAPNLLLNMLEMMHHEDAQVSKETRQQIFKQVVQSQNVKLLQRAEDLIVWKNRQDPNLMRLLIVGYVHAGAPEKACELLLRWNSSDASSYPAPSITSFRLVLTVLAKKGDHQRAFELLRQLCEGKESQPKASSSSFLSSTSATNYNLLPAPDRDCFQRVLLACDKSQDNAAFGTAQQVMQLMAPQQNDNVDESTKTKPHHDIDTLPTRSSIRLFLKVWKRSQNPQERQMLKEKAFDWLRDMERTAQRNYDLHKNVNSSSTVPKTIPDVQCYNLVLDALAEGGDYQQADAYLQRMLTDYLKGKSIIQPDDVSLHTVLKAHIQAGTVEAAEAAEAFLEIIRIFATQQQHLLDRRKGRGGKESQSNERRDGIREPSQDDVSKWQQNETEMNDNRFAELQPKARAYAAVIALWVKLGEPDRAIQALKNAEDWYQSQLTNGRKNTSQFRPDVICYRSIVSALSKTHTPTGDVAIKAQSVAQQMIQMRHRPDLLLCNTILSIWVKAGRPEDAETFLETYMEQDYRVFDIISYNIVIQGYCNAENGLDRAIEILKRLVQPGPTMDFSSLPLPNPNTRTFTIILTALSREKTLDAATQAEEMILEMQELYEKRKMNTQPNLFSFNAVLNCWASLSYADRKNSRLHGRRAMEILEGMKAFETGPDVVSYNTCIKAQRNDTKTAENLLKDMLANGCLPNDNTWKTLMFVLKHDNTFKNKDERADYLRNKYFSHLDSRSRISKEWKKYEA